MRHGAHSVALIARRFELYFVPDLTQLSALSVLSAKGVCKLSSCQLKPGNTGCLQQSPLQSPAFLQRPGVNGEISI
jgi:hypothetical protein